MSEHDRPAPLRTTRRHRFAIRVGALGTTAALVGYLLEAIRQRGDCDLGDKSPDTLVVSVVLIVFVAGLCGLAGLAASAVAAARGQTAAGTLAGFVLSAVSLALAASIVVVGGDGPATWFQYCGT